MGSAMTADERRSAATDDWYHEVAAYTRRLVGIRSVNPSRGETDVAAEVLRLLQVDGLDGSYTQIGLDPIVGDPFERQNAFALVRGASPRTVVLLGHVDTVDTADYGELEPWALDPDALAAREQALRALAPDSVPDLEAHPGEWMFGRGVIDMKCGVAANIAVMRRLARLARHGRLPLSAVLLATPDEESESAGMLQAVRLLLRLRSECGLDYLGAINTDYTTGQYPGDPHRYIYTGSIGKLLPSFLVIGRESHVGAPFDGMDANLLAAELIGDLSMDDALCDRVRGQVTPPPVTLRAADLKARYDVQLPFAAYFYLNFLTYTTGPAELLERLRDRAEAALVRVLSRVDVAERRWIQAQPESGRVTRSHRRGGSVWTYAEVRAAAVERVGRATVEAELAREWDRWPADLDKRERSLHLTYRLWTLSGLQGPAVVLYYSPPYYPHVAAEDSALHRAMGELAQGHPELNLSVQEYYPYLSDMSYMRLDPGLDTSALVDNMPVWRQPDAPPRPGSYSLPLDEVRALGMPVVNLGPYGAGAHQRGERALITYSFGILPWLVYETIERLVETEESP
jgi:arginine utilization protein RocB